MPVLQQNDDGSGYTIRGVDDDDRTTFHDLRPEGARILMNVYGIRVGDTVDVETVEKLVGLRLAAPRPAPVPPVARPPEPRPAPPPIPAPPRSRLSGGGPLSRSSREQERAEPAARPGWTRPNPVSEPRGYIVRNQRRTRGREVALQVLYQVEQNTAMPQAEVDRFLLRRLQEPNLCEFAGALVSGVKANREAIDAMITEVAENWRLDRMAAIDRNILRLGAYEMLFDAGVPAKVAINEALELAKRYSTAQSSRFVNGILDRLLTTDARKLAKVEPEPPPAES